ncbi:MAG: leucine-rich repeat domain-containing protein, partial [Thermoguttaceae bacterium]|nr:leucine-rich repeat domain-containing protein [Thermoguttaceae bacterium]
MTLQDNISALPNPATDFEWSVENDVVTIDKFLPENATSAVVPAEIDGRPDAKIGVRAFKNRATLTQVAVPEGVKSLGDSAFSGCAALTQVVLPQGLEQIGNRAFAGCSALTE